MPADLHLHTTASDGTDSVEERTSQAAKADLDTISLTDHDAINSELDGRFFIDDKTGVTVITGAEIKCKAQDTGIEILGYFLDPESDRIKDLLRKNSKLREERINSMIDNLNRELDYNLTQEEVFRHVEGNPGRPYIARALVEAEEVEDVKVEEDAFELYIGEDCPAYVPAPKQDAEKVVETVLDEGGVPVLAHPGRDIQEHEADKIVAELVGYGLKGIEVRYSWDHKRKNSYEIHFGETLSEDLADEYGLLRTGGSDCHGSGSDKYLIGSVRLSNSQVRNLVDLSDADGFHLL